MDDSINYLKYSVVGCMDPVFTSCCPSTTLNISFGCTGAKSLTKVSVFSSLDENQLLVLCMLSLELSVNIPDTFTKIKSEPLLSGGGGSMGGKHQEVKC